VAVVVASTDLDEVCELSDRVHVVRAGAVVQVLEGPELTPARVLVAAAS
jgi:ABC-type sugar transport system ATPase subunit